MNTCYNCATRNMHSFHDDGTVNTDKGLLPGPPTDDGRLREQVAAAYRRSGIPPGPDPLKFEVPSTRHPIYYVFKEAYALVEGKASDYAEDDNVYSNFEFAASAAGITVEQSFLNLIGVKVARLQQLIGNDKTPNNESIDDTLLDLMNYAGLLKAYRQKKMNDDLVPMAPKMLKEAWADLAASVEDLEDVGVEKIEPPSTAHSLAGCDCVDNG